MRSSIMTAVVLVTVHSFVSAAPVMVSPRWGINWDNGPEPSSVISSLHFGNISGAMAPTVVPALQSPQVPDRAIPPSAQKSPLVTGASLVPKETISEAQGGDTGDQSPHKKSKHPRTDTSRDMPVAKTPQRVPQMRRG